MQITNHKIIPIDGEKVFHVNGNHENYTKRDRTPEKFRFYPPSYKNWNQAILAEEFCLGDIKNAHKYILKIETFDENLTEKGINKIKEYCKKYNIEFNIKLNLKF